MFKAVFLDIDNTLLDFALCAKSSMRQGFRDFGLDFQDSMIDVFTDINDKLWRALERGELTIERLHAIRFGLVFDALGIKADGAAFEKAFIGYLHDSHEPVTGAMELIRYLAPKYRLFAASNGPYGQQENRLKLSGMLPYFENLFVSERIGAQKPTRAFFDACMKALPELSAKDVILVGDSLTADIQGGLDYGITTLWYNHTRAAANLDIPPDYTVLTLKEIEGIL